MNLDGVSGTRTRDTARSEMNATPTRPPIDAGQAPRDPAALLADYADREVVLLPGAHGSRLVVDRLVDDAGDPRLVAHLTSDEPDLNAVVVTDIYLADPRRRARPLTDDDLRRRPLASPEAAVAGHEPVLTDAYGIRFRLAPIDSVGLGPPELRWLRQPPAGTEGPAECVSSRRVVGALEDYEPVRSLNAAAIARHLRDPAVSVATLGLELRRLATSPIVLNRRLREAVVDASLRRGLSLSAMPSPAAGSSTTGAVARPVRRAGSPAGSASSPTRAPAVRPPGSTPTSLA